jgi:hypothetical protein
MPSLRLRWTRRRLAIGVALPALLIAATATFGPDFDRYFDHDTAACGQPQDPDADPDRAAPGNCGPAGESADIMAASAQFSAVRTAPGTHVSSQALTAAAASTAAMPVTAGNVAWSQLTTSYQSQNSSYSQGP